MVNSLLAELKKITQEEQQILSGQKNIRKELYMSAENDVIDAKKLIEAGKLIQVRPHTRFIHFPKHTHNYIEVIYMCSGSTHHIINGADVVLEQGELLFLNQKAEQEIYPATEEDIAVNFFILPIFFEYGLKMIDTDESMLRDFVIGCIKGENESSSYMHFKVSHVLPIQNLVENLIWTIWNKQTNKRSVNQITMGLLFLQLMNHLDYMETDIGKDNKELVLQVLYYIEEHYQNGTLSELAGQLHYNLHWLSKEIKKRTGKTYTELVQTKRLQQAGWLLQHTRLSVIDVSLAVGYDNASYFHRIFRKKYEVSPRRYRLEKHRETI